MQRGNQHLGIPDEQAIEQLIDVFTRGLWRRTGTSFAEEKSQGKDRAGLNAANRKNGAAAHVVQQHTA
jgi:hypothetical protein